MAMVESFHQILARLSTLSLITVVALSVSGLAAADGVPPRGQVDDSVVTRGEYLAQAADCAACHSAPQGDSDSAYSGGFAIQSPMGDIYSSNITPSKQFGIGDWSESDFAKAIRQGVTPDGTHLYPAMPYDSFAGITDDDIHAMYKYFMHGVQPVDEAPQHQTELSFPFSQRWLMAGWNLLFTDDQRFMPRPNERPQVARGRYLVDNLAHCGTCHTPRNALMASDSKLYLAGAPLGGWFAPNITSDKVSGIGGWSDQELVSFLKNGHVEGKGVAAGGMAEAVERSLRLLKDNDLHAMVSYLRTVPTQATSEQEKASYRYGDDSGTPYDFQDRSTQITKHDVRKGRKLQADVMADTSDFSGLTNGAVLYESSCSSCHQLNGSGTEDNYYPSLFHNTTTGGETPNNLVMTILEGIKRTGADGETAMPAFGKDYSDQQVAAVVNYVAQRFGNPKLHVTAERVATLRAGGDKPLLAKLGTWVIVIPIAIILVVIFGVILWLYARTRFKRRR